MAMPTRLHRSTLAPLLLAALAAAALVPAAQAVFRAQAEARFEIRYLPASGPLRHLSAPLRLSIANYYWMMAVQYVGDPTARRQELPLVLPLLELVTDLDPGHCYAYQAGGLVLGSYRVEESDAILQKGMRGCPDWWSYPFYLAFNDFYYRGDYPSAARWAEVAARKPGARPSISKLAMALKVKSGDPEEAVQFIEEMRATVTDERFREALDEQYREARLQRDFALLDGAVARFTAERRRPPARLGELVEAGLLERLPAEPYGGEYLLRDGAVRSTGRDYRVPAAEPGLFEKRKAWDAARRRQQEGKP
jgi:hypothetical protein